MVAACNPQLLYSRVLLSISIVPLGKQDKTGRARLKSCTEWRRAVDEKRVSSRFARLFAIIVMRGIVTMEGENGQPWLRCKIEWAVRYQFVATHSWFLISNKLETILLPPPTLFSIVFFFIFLSLLTSSYSFQTSLLTLCSNWPGHLREQKPLMDHGARYNRTWHCEEVEEEKKGRHIVVIKFLNTQIVAIGL